MKAHYQRLAQYNIWGNSIVCDWLSDVNVEQWQQHLVSSFNSIKETCVHIMSAEHIWYERLIKVENPIWLALNFDANKDHVIATWAEASSKLQSFVDELEENELTNLLAYKRINGDAYEQPINEVLTHVFNHSTYHRGQLVTLLRQVGYDGITSTDYLLFSRL